MLYPTSGMLVGLLRSIFAFTALLAVATVHGQTANVVAANSVNNEILGVTFAPPGGSTTILNQDESSLYSLQSLAFIFNGTNNSFDLLAADNQKGQILRYVGDFSTSPPNTIGSPVTTSITYPNGLSVDSGGDLFVVDDAPGHSPQPQVWVLQSNGSGGFLAAKRIDSQTTFGKLQATVETLIVGSPPSNQAPLGNGANAGDLLVLTTNPNSVLRYQGSGGNGPLSSVPPSVLLGQCPNPPATACIPAGTVPAGIAVWPTDNSAYSNSLLISTQGGTILAYSFAGASPTQLQNFATGLASGLFKIKTAYQGGNGQGGNGAAFVVQSGPGNHGSVLELAPPVNGQNSVVATVMTKVAAPEGIAATNTVQGQTSNCQQNLDGTGGCDLLGGKGPRVLKHNVIGGAGLTGSIVEDLCVAVDPRQPSANGACGDVPLKVNDACGANFDDTNALYIPGYYCGAAGGKHLIAVKTHTDPSQYNNKYIESAADANNLLPSANNPVCGPKQVNTQLALPIEAVLWGMQTGEGTTVDKTSVNGVLKPSMANTENGCGDGRPGSSNLSLWVFGVDYDTTASELQSPYAQPLWNIENINYTALLATVTSLYSAGSIGQTEALLLTNTIPNPPPNTPPGCIDNSLNDFTTATQLFPLSGPGIDPNGPTAYFQAAANLVTNAAVSMTVANNQNPANNTTCDSIVTDNPGPPAFVEQPAVPIWNPSGQVHTRLGPVQFAGASLILSNPAPSTWPAPLTINASCPDNQSCPTTEKSGSGVTVNNLNGSVNASNVSLNLTWAVNPQIATKCSLTSDDGVYTQTAISTLTQPLHIRPPTADGIYHQYSITCSVPDNTTVPPVGNPGQETISATAWVVNFAAPPPPPPPKVGVTVSPTTTTDDHNLVTITLTPPNGAAGCTVTDTNATGLPLAFPGPNVATYSTVESDAGHTITFTATCSIGASPNSGTVTVDNL